VTHKGIFWSFKFVHNYQVRLFCNYYITSFKFKKIIIFWRS